MLIGFGSYGQGEQHGDKPGECAVRPPPSGVPCKSHLEVTEIDGRGYRRATQECQQAISSNFVAYKMRPPTTVGKSSHVLALAIPLPIPKNPDSVLRWYYQQRDACRGIIVNPPPGWVPGQRMDGESITIWSTNDLGRMLMEAGVDAPGNAFVLHDPRDGWAGAPPPPREPERLVCCGPGTSGRWLLPLGAGIFGFVLATAITSRM